MQRVPPTESRGRIHTSIVSVAVLHEPEKKHRTIKDSEIEWEAMRGSGPGGQHRNKTSSTVRMKHMPSGLTVTVDGRCQHQNRKRARRLLEAKIAETEDQEALLRHNGVKREQIGDRRRSQKIRTYNFKRQRAVDHRTGKKTRNVDEVMNGRFDLLK